MTSTSFLSGLKSGRYKFALAEQKAMTLAEALRKAADFIRATKIYADSFDVPKKVRVPGDKNFNRSDRNPGSRERRPPFEAFDP